MTTKTPVSAAWTIERSEPSIFTLQIRQRVRALSISDLHWDNAHCDRAALKRDLDEAKANGSPVFMFGDIFCAMQGKWDPRKDEKQLRPEHRGSCYFDKLVDTASTWFAPYAQNIALITHGNHETSIISRQQTNLIERLHGRLGAVKGYAGQVGAYAGFIKVQDLDNKRPRSCMTVYFNHGYGGGGEVTRGMIDNSRTRSQVNADIFVSGHVHRRNMDENVIEELDPNHMKIKLRRQWFLRNSTYKQEDGSTENDISGWHVERGRAARPIGGWWMDFKPVHSHGQCRIDFTPTPTTS